MLEKSMRITVGPASDPKASRAVRVFVSSTFNDMQAERDILVRRVFPAMRARMRERGVELVEVDLRWGVTAEQVSDGKTVPICLGEVDRCRPFFIGLVGERYGWIVPGAALTEELRRAYPILDHCVDLSLTEIEMRYGVLDAPGSDAEALFFLRDPAWLESLPEPDRRSHIAETPEALQRLADLKARIRGSGARVVEYDHPAEIAEAVATALGARLDTLFPPSDAAAGFDHTMALHAAYARDRLGLHVGAHGYVADLDLRLADTSAPPLLVTGVAGAGKSALIANWLTHCADGQARVHVFMHFLGASTDSADPMLLLRRLWRFLDRSTGESVALPSDDKAMVDELPQRLARAGATAGQAGASLLIALDGLDKLSHQPELQWWPAQLPPAVRLLASSLAGPAADAALRRGWRIVQIGPLQPADRVTLIEQDLAKVGKSLTSAQLGRMLAHPHAGNPLFLKTMLNELRVFGHYEALDRRIDWYLSAIDTPGLFDRVLERLETDHGRALVRAALVAIWASRAGLEETEILAIADVPGIEWSALRLGLGEAVRDQGGRITFGHDYLRQAVTRRYLPSRDEQRTAHLVLADRFAAQIPDARRAEELPYQLRAAEAWDRLETVLCDMSSYDVLSARGSLELVGYWLPLTALGKSPEARLCAAFSAQFPDPDAWRSTEIDLVRHLFEFFGYRGEFGEDSLRLARQAAQVGERLITSLPPGATCHALLANVLRERDDVAVACEVERKALELYRRHYGPEHVSTLYAMSNLAATLAELGDLEAAQALEEEVLAIRLRINGSHHRDTYAAMYNLAHTMRARGEVKAAQTLQRRVLDGQTRLFGPDHRETLMALETLAVTHYRLGELDKAEALERRVVEIRMRVLGPDHPDTLLKLAHLAETLRTSGKRREALGILEQALCSQMRQLGPEHPETLASISQRASILRESGAVHEALRLQTGVLEVQSRKWGPDSAAARHSLRLITLAHITARNLRSARDASRLHLEACSRALGPGDAGTLAAHRYHRDIVRQIWGRRIRLAIVLIGGPLIMAGWIGDRTGSFDLRTILHAIRTWLGRK